MGPLAGSRVTRGVYGGDKHCTTAVSELPGGGAVDKGLPLDSGIPGSSTHNKDVDTPVREFDKGDDESLYRTDNADDQLTNRDRIDFRDDNSGNHDGVRPWNPGGSDWEDASSKTKYPYRDGKPNTKNASATYVLARWEVEQAPVRRLQAGARIKIAVRLSGIVEGLNPKFEARGKNCAVELKRSDTKNLRWILAVDCHKGGGPRVVKVKAVRNNRVTNLSKMDLDLTCSCPAWQWQGPEHHSQREDYLDGQPRGTASVPIVRDPDGINRVCKHVYASLLFIKDWNVQRKKAM